MDSGLGIVANYIVPNEPEVPRLPPKSKLQLPRGFLEKPYVRHALKYIEDAAQQEKALEVALAWKKKFAAKEWKPVVAAIEAAHKEDNLRSPPDAQAPEDPDPAFLADRPPAITAVSAPIVPRAIPWPASRRIGFRRQHTANAPLLLRRIPASTTPRICRWDVLSSGPVTPLSPMPTGNSFASSALSTPTLHAQPFGPSTPVTAMIPDPESPFLPQDPEAREAYKTVKDEVDAVARKYCLARFNTSTSRDSNDFVPATMIKPQDVLEAATMVLHSKKVKLKEAIVEDLPDRLRRRAVEETRLRNRLTIKNEAEFAEQMDWMNNEALELIPEVHDKDKDYIPPPTHFVLSILDEQREVLRMFRRQPENSDLELSQTATEAAWAVRVLEDAEHLMASDADGSSNGDDDEGYSYQNFLRSLKSEMSVRTSTSSGALTSMVDELSNSDLTSLRSRANTNQTLNSMRSREFRFPQRSSTSPTKKNSWPTRLSESSATSSSRDRSNSLFRRTDLSIATNTIEEVPKSELSPEDREYRHRGPNRADLDYWAEELKKMEAMRAERQQSQSIHRRPARRDNSPSGSTHQRTPTMQTFLDETATLNSRFSSSSSSAQSNMLEPLPRPSHAPSLASSTLHLNNRPTVLDHQYHQRNLSKSPARTHRRDNSKDSMHDSLRRHQHLRSTSSVSVLAKRTTKVKEDDWLGELKKMEGRERDRQAEERRRMSQH